MYKDAKALHSGGTRARNLLILEADAMTNVNHAFARHCLKMSLFWPFFRKRGSFKFFQFIRRKISPEGHSSTPVIKDFQYQRG
jgi:hypothetical protein